MREQSVTRKCERGWDGFATRLPRCVPVALAPWSTSCILSILQTDTSIASWYPVWICLNFTCISYNGFFISPSLCVWWILHTCPNKTHLFRHIGVNKNTCKQVSLFCWLKGERRRNGDKTITWHSFLHSRQTFLRLCHLKNWLLGTIGVLESTMLRFEQNISFAFSAASLV